jgi:hypothetical protein
MPTHLAADHNGHDLAGGLAQPAGDLLRQLQRRGLEEARVLLHEAGRWEVQAILDVRVVQAAEVLVEGGGLDASGAKVEGQDNLGRSHRGDGAGSSATY